MATREGQNNQSTENVKEKYQKYGGTTDKNNSRIEYDEGISTDRYGVREQGNWKRRGIKLTDFDLRPSTCLVT
jgi:hypothetical protein